MKKFTVMFMLLLASSVFLSYGCGGGGGSSTDNDTSDDTEPIINNEAYYEPIALTHSELVALAETLVPPESFDMSWLDQQDNTAASAVTASQTAQSRRKSMWQHAVKMVNRPDLLDLHGNFMNHGTTAEKTRQNRFLYVYLEYPDYKDERETLLNHQYRASADPYKWNANGCTHDIMGTDCVGFVYQCAYEATKNETVTVTNKQGQRVSVNGLRMRYGAYRSQQRTNANGNTYTVYGIGSSSVWRDTGFFPDAYNVEDTTNLRQELPEPGDILVWNGHVGIAVMIDGDKIGVAHSTGQINRPYTCEEYNAYGAMTVWDILNNLNRAYNELNGFGVNEYKLGKGITTYGVEKNRVRLAIGTPSQEDNYDEEYISATRWIDIADTSWYSDSANTFSISTARQLAGFSKLVQSGTSFSNKTITLASDIDLSGKEWTSQNTFRGTFNGGGHTISGITVTNNSGNALYGFFSAVGSEGTVSNLKLSDVNINVPSALNVGGLTGSNEGTIQNCTVDGQVTGSMGVGMIAGGNYGRINQCTAESGSVTSRGRLAGGIAGSSYNTITGCKSYASVSASSEAGGIAGESWTSSAVLTSCEAYGRVSGGSYAFGGIVGKITSSSTISGNKFSSSTGQTYGIGDGSSNRGCELID